MSSSPTIAGWELALRLKALRQSQGIDVARITAELGFTRNYWSAVENARTIMSEDRLRSLLDLLKCDRAERRQLLALRSESRERAWWHEDGVAEQLQRLYGLEHGASRIRSYEGVVVSGLLQTPAYARALISFSPAKRMVDVDRNVEIRMRRQERLVATDPPVTMTVVMAQGVLLQHVGEPEVLGGQLRHLLRMLDTPSDSLELRIVPFTRAPGGLIGSSTMLLLDFDRPLLPTIAWQETMDFALTEDDETIRYLTLSFQQALDASLSREESRRLIEQCLADVERSHGT